ncbi:MAG: cupin domain-containing protein [Planctomycetota bacterium]|jgi:uncharacterized cupin superfamily protein
MTKEAPLEHDQTGIVPTRPGWFVINFSEAQWYQSERFGKVCNFEGKQAFLDYGVNVRILSPDQPACFYHRENFQEDFLVLKGECLLIVEGQERSLKTWDFFHSPAGTDHVLVGAGDGPCVILMMGTRDEDQELCYPVEPLAQAKGAGVQKETDDPRVAYAGITRATPCAPPEQFLDS